MTYTTRKINIILLILLTGCFSSKPSNAIEELGEEVIKKREGIEIRLTPIEEEKNKTTKSLGSCLRRISLFGNYSNVNPTAE